MLGRPDHVDLPDVVHHRESRDADALGGGGERRELRRELRGATAPGEVRDVISKVQR